MNTVDAVKALCKERKVSLCRLERELEFGNGYIGRLRKGTMPADRVQKVAEYFDVPMESLILGDEPKETEKSPIVTDEGLSERKLRLIEIIKNLPDADLEKLERMIDLILQ